MRAPRPRLGELERASGGIGRVGQPAARVQRVRQPVQGVGGGRPLPERRVGLGDAAERDLVPRGEGQRPLVRRDRVRRAVHLREDPADAGMRQRPVGGDRGRLAVRVDRGVVPAAKRRDVAAPQRVLVALVEGGGSARRGPGTGRHPRRGSRPIARTLRAARILRARLRRVVRRAHPSTSTRSAFWTWSRFSDWSQMMLRGPSITAEVISSPRWAGRQCIATASGPAASSRASSTR